MRGLACLSHAGEADEVGTETEASALTSRHTDGGGDEVENSENRRSDEGKGGNLIEREAVAGDKNGGARNNETLDQILDSAIDNFGDVHLFYIHALENFLPWCGCFI